MTRLCDEAERLYSEAARLERAGLKSEAAQLVVVAASVAYAWAAGNPRRQLAKTGSVSYHPGRRPLTIEVIT